MNLKEALRLVSGMVFGVALATAGNLTYTCDPTIDATQAGTCAYLNSTIAGQYGSTFTNANADIYIEQGITGLGESTSGFLNLVSYSTYLTALTAEGGPGAVRADAVASLPGSEPALYNGADIEITSALGNALGIGGMVGTTAGGSPCFTPGSGGCYNGIIIVTTPANLSSETGGTQFLYWDQTGGSQPGDAYDFYTVVEHETDEVLGTSSCIDTGGGVLSDGCTDNTAAAVDLFRYQGAGTRVFESNTPGAYFSYDAGVTNGADGAVYNTLSNGDDYADFAGNCQHVQDATGCLGSEFNITNDGGAEINILDAVGYNLQQQGAVPEPGTMALFGLGLLGIGVYQRRRRA